MTLSVHGMCEIYLLIRIPFRLGGIVRSRRRIVTWIRKGAFGWTGTLAMLSSSIKHQPAGLTGPLNTTAVILAVISDRCMWKTGRPVRKKVIVDGPSHRYQNALVNPRTTNLRSRIRQRRYLDRCYGRHRVYRLDICHLGTSHGSSLGIACPVAHAIFLDVCWRFPMLS